MVSKSRGDHRNVPCTSICHGEIKGSSTLGKYKGQSSPVTSWIILAAVVQVVTSQPMLRSGVEQVCPGNTILFICTTTGSSTLGWSSEDYIGSGRQLQFRSIDNNGTVEISPFNPETIATLTAIDANGPILTSILRIIARPTTPNVSVSCIDIGGETSTLTISLAAVPGVPQRIDAAEISQPRDNICIILVTWDPPTNSDASDIAQYIVYVPSRNIRNDISSSTLTTLTVSNCGDDIRIQIAAVSRDGCVGMNSSEVLPVPLDSIPTAPGPAGNGSVTTEGGSARISSSVVAAASVLAILFIISCIVLVVVPILFVIHYKRGKKIEAAEQAPPPEVLKLEEHVETETKLIGDLQKSVQDTSVKRNLEELYNALKLKLPFRKMQAAARDLKATLMSGMESSKFNESVKEMFISYFEALQVENEEVVKRVIENMDNILTGMTGIDEEFKESVRLLRTKIGTSEYKKVLGDLIKQMEKAQPSTIMSILLSLCEKLRNVRQVKDYFYKQTKYDISDLGTKNDRVSVPIWIDDKLDDGWKAGLREAVKAINEAAPGLSLSIIEDEKQAIIHVLAIDNKDSEPYTEVEGNILMRSKEENFVTKIRLGKWKDDGKKGVCIHELLHALGFHHEHQYYAIADHYVYHLDSKNKLTIDKNELGFIRFDTSSTTLYPCEEKCREHSEDHVCKWVLEAYPARVNTEFDELDMVGLNLVYPPCIDKTEPNNIRYRPKLGRNGMYYCGREVMVACKYSHDQEYTRFCGPDKGPNCPACRTIMSPQVKEILEGGRWQGMTGRVYCGRPFTEPGLLSTTHDGMCGLGNGPVCPDCYKILSPK